MPLLNTAEAFYYQDIYTFYTFTHSNTTLTEAQKVFDAAQAALEQSRQDTGTQMQLRNANAEEVFSEAETYFGTTENFKDAGWIIPNGKMLDFGKRAKDHGMGPTSMAHWDVLEILKKRGSDFFAATEDFMNLGAMRMSDKGAFIQMSLETAPTQAQLDTVAKFADAHNGNIRINYGSEKTKLYEYADAKNIISDIEQQYSGKKKYESTLNEFRDQFEKRGTTADGIEIYETDIAIANLSYAEKIKRFQDNFYTPGSPHYIGQYVQFVRNGKVNYAEINRYTQNENTEKINPAHLNQWDKAKINVGASGDFITLLENTSYDKERTNGNKTKNDAHKVTDAFEYYLKTVYIDSRPFNVVVNVSRKADNSRFVYDVVLKQNKTLPQLGPQTTNNSRRPKVQSTRLLGNVSNNNSTPTLTESQGEDQKQVRVTAEQDAQYLELAKDPEANKDKLQEMVLQAAKNWGAIDNPYSDDMVFYHGTKGDFFRFEDRTGQNHEGYARLGSGHYFTATRNAAEFWAKKAKGEGNSHVMPVYLKTENLLNAYDKPTQDIIDALPEGINADSIIQIAQDLSEAGINSAEFFKGLGYDGIVSDKKTGKGYDRDNYEIVVFSPEQIKSAKTNTYDDAGNVIPLSERFNAESKDIRYQMRNSAAHHIKNPPNFYFGGFYFIQVKQAAELQQAL